MFQNSFTYQVRTLCTKMPLSICGQHTLLKFLIKKGLVMIKKLTLLTTISTVSMGFALNAFADQYASSYSSNTTLNTSNTSQSSGNSFAQSQNINTTQQTNNSKPNIASHEVRKELEIEFLRDNKKSIRAILVTKIDDIVSSEKTTKLALFLAAQYGFYNPMDKILTHPNLKNKPNQEDINMMVDAAAINHINTMKYLLAGPAGILLPDHRGVHKAFATAGCGGYISIMDLLIQQKYLTTPNQESVNEAFFLAAGGGHLDTLTWLLTPHNNLPNGTSLPLPTGEATNRALIWAAENGHRHIVEFLCVQHENISLPDQNNINQALQAAAYHARFEVVEYILTQHAGIPLPDQNAMILAVINAAVKGHIHLINNLLKQRVGVPSLDQTNMTKIYEEVQKAEEDKDSPKRKIVLEFLRKQIQQPAQITAQPVV